MNNDQRSKDISSAKLAAKLKHIAKSTKTRWASTGNEQFVEHLFELEGTNHIYTLNVSADHTIKAFRAQGPYKTPRTMSDDFAKLLYMKVWPDVGI